MSSRGSRGGVGERVLESRHVIGLFLLMLLFSGVFFALGYVMGRNQYDGQVRAATNSRTALESAVQPKADAGAKRGGGASSPETPAADAATPPSSDWGFYNSGKAPADENLKTSPASQVSAVAKDANSAHAANVSSKTVRSGELPRGSYTVQVAALRKQSDALALANTLQRKKFPAFVSAPQSDRYYHVRVGPYTDQKSADAAKKGLESAGFKAIVKH